MSTIEIKFQNKIENDCFGFLCLIRLPLNTSFENLGQFKHKFTFENFKN